jgi:HlyD family secretion protein
MTRRTRLVLLAAAVVFAALVVLGLRGEARLVELAEVHAGPLTVTTQEEGKTRLRDRYLLSAPVAGTLRRVAFEQGDAVRSGQVLAEIEPSTAALLDPASRARLQAEAEAAADMSRAAQSRLAATEAALRLARSERDRLFGMPKQQVVSQAQRDAAQARLEQAQAEYDAAHSELEASRRRAQAVRALLSEEGTSGGRALLPLHAPIDGVLIRRHVESSAPVAPGQPLLELGDPAALEIEVEALSTEAVKLRPGMAARIVRWGGEDALEGRVLRVEPGGFTKISALGVEEQRVRVIVEISTPRERWTSLGDGYRVEVEFVLWQGEQVLQVPSSALFRHAGGWAVFAVDDGRARRVAVEIGARGGLATEVKGGLRAGQRVVSHPDDRIAEGVRLRARD